MTKKFVQRFDILQEENKLMCDILAFDTNKTEYFASTECKGNKLLSQILSNLLPSPRDIE